MKLEEYINKDEISQLRTPQEYVNWFEKKLAITKKLKEELGIQNLLHKGIAKDFYEELFPLYRLLQNKLKEWKGMKFKPVIGGHKSYDVEVSNCKKDSPSYIEITVTDFDEAEKARMEYLLNNVLAGNVLIKRDEKTGKKISVIDNEAHRCEEINQKFEKRIVKRINHKMMKNPPPNTALLVNFDDYIAFCYDKANSKIKMNSFLDSITIQWQNKFVALYIAGDSGKSFYERRHA